MATRNYVSFLASFTWPCDYLYQRHQSNGRLALVRSGKEVDRETDYVALEWLFSVALIFNS